MGGPEASDKVKEAVAKVWTATDKVGGKTVQNTQVFGTSGPDQGEISQKFDLKVWKSTYEPTNAAMSKFWKTYDREGWSIWTCTYDYAEDNEDLESTKNIVTEFMAKTKPIEVNALESCTFVASWK